MSDSRKEPTEEEELANAMDDQADALDRVKPGHLVATDDAVILLRAAAAEIRRLVEALRSSQSRVEELEKALVKYGIHGDRCNVWHAWGPGPHKCDCGFTALTNSEQGRDSKGDST